MRSLTRALRAKSFATSIVARFRYPRIKLRIFSPCFSLARPSANPYRSDFPPHIGLGTIALQQLKQSVIPGVKIISMTLNGTPKVSYSLSVPIMGQLVSVTYSKDGTTGVFNTTRIPVWNRNTQGGETSGRAGDHRLFKSKWADFVR
jgi:hypothetical protein